MNKAIGRENLEDKKSKTDEGFETRAQKIALRAIQSYDYLEGLVLKSGGIPLCVNSKEAIFLKRMGAVYCDEGWFCPLGKGAHFEELAQFFPRTFREEKNVLVPRMIPQPLWGKNLRSFLRREEWDSLRSRVYDASGHRCVICGGRGDRWAVECHEMWDYRLFNDGSAMSVLVGLRALCPRCHRVNHLGKARVDGVYEETLFHMAGVNQWPMRKARLVSQKAFEVWKERSKKRWVLGYDDTIDWDPLAKKILRDVFPERRGA